MIVWVGTIAFLVLLIVVDLLVFHRHSHALRFREALGWVAMWVSIALAFNVFVYFLYAEQWFGFGIHPLHALTGEQAALQFFTGYVIEQSLSVDNIFVIAIILSYFHIPARYQHRVLFWGILGAIVMRGVMIAAGAALLREFSWMDYVFGVLLLGTAVRLLIMREESVHPERNFLVRWTKRVYRVSHDLESGRFFDHVNGRRAVTPIFLALLLIESTDLMFAIDSIPAVLAITDDPFLAFSSNMFAVLGLRAMYFVLAGAMGKFRYLKTSLVFLLAFVGVKMLIGHHYEIETALSLAIIGGILAVGVIASLIAGEREEEPAKAIDAPGSDLQPGPEEAP